MPTAVPSAVIHAAVAAVRDKIDASCARVQRDPHTVRLIAVTKNQDPAVLTALVEAGICDVAENRLEHHAVMWEAAQAGGMQLRFHAIGRVQGRQLAKWAPLSDVLHSLCDIDHVARLARACDGRRFPIYVQVNTSGQTSKAGCTPAALASLLDAVRAASTLEAVGLMTMAAEGAAESELRLTFSRLRELAEKHALTRLSMGMSQDFQVAIEEGATDIRIGTRLFQ